MSPVLPFKEKKLTETARQIEDAVDTELPLDPHKTATVLLHAFRLFGHRGTVWLRYETGARPSHHVGRRVADPGHVQLLPLQQGAHHRGATSTT